MGRNDPWLDMGLRGLVHGMGREGNGASLWDTQVSGPRSLINLVNNVSPLSKKDLVFIGHVRTFPLEPAWAGQQNVPLL